MLGWSEVRVFSMSTKCLHKLTCWDNNQAVVCKALLVRFVDTEDSDFDHYDR